MEALRNIPDIVEVDRRAAPELTPGLLAIHIEYMAKKKYGKPVPETYRRGAVEHVRGAKPGPRTAAEKRALCYPQAENVINKFGGARELARVLKEFAPDDPTYHFAPSTIYRWAYPEDVGGCGGEIPTRAIKRIVRAARFAGIMLTLEDLYPNIF